jgi:hypothetical protein
VAAWLGAGTASAASTARGTAAANLHAHAYVTCAVRGSGECVRE